VDLYKKGREKEGVYKMSGPKFDFHKYARDLARYADKIDTREATSTHRLGGKRLRDVFVFWRNTYSEGNYYLGLFKDMLMLLALMPLAMAAIGLPTEFSVMLVIAYITICSVLGFVSYRFLALPRREQEMADLMSMSRFMVWDLLKQIQEEQIKQRPKKKVGVRKK
jgi:hypothetical protein